MKELLMLNHRNESRKIMIETAALGAVLFVVMIFYKFNKVLLFQAATWIKSMPEELYAFLGIFPGTEAGNCNFFLFYAAMLLFLWFAWKAVYGTIYIVEENESSGRTFRICNQLYSRKQMIRALYVKALLQFYIRYIIWAVFLLLMIFTGSSSQAQRRTGCTVWGRMIGMGLLVFAAYITVAFLYSVKKRDAGFSDSFCCIIVFCPWIAANLYKLTGVARIGAQYIEKEISEQGLEAVRAVLEKLYWISPLSWCNPFAQGRSWGVTMVQTLLCIGVSGFALVCAEHSFEKKEFFLP